MSGAVVRRVVLTSAAALVLVCLAAGPAAAHTVTIGQSKIRQHGALVRYELAVSYDELAKRVDLGAGVPLGVRAVSDDTARAQALRDAADAVTSFLVAQVRVAADGDACRGDLDELDVVRHSHHLYAIATLTYRCASAAARSYEVVHELLFDALADAERASHANVADVELGAASGRVLFQPGSRRLVTRDDELVFTATAPAPPASGLAAGGAGVVGVAALVAGVAVSRRRR